MKKANVRVIIDTNVWISFLIGKRLKKLQGHLLEEAVTIIICDQLISEILLVSRRNKLRKYFPIETIDEFILLL
jgi:putative PIN family toxin of toxin-antitoxin system